MTREDIRRRKQRDDKRRQEKTRKRHTHNFNFNNKDKNKDMQAITTAGNKTKKDNEKGTHIDKGT